MVAEEIERKFRLAERPDSLEGCVCEPIEQGYLVTDANGIEVRVRRVGERAALTIKSGRGLARVEEETSIEPEQFDSLWKLTEGRRLRKRRYTVGADPAVEVDVYDGPLEGLVVAEIEFDSRRDADRFDPPAWLEREVTADERYANRNLALEGLPGED